MAKMLEPPVPVEDAKAVMHYYPCHFRAEFVSFPELFRVSRMSQGWVSMLTRACEKQTHEQSVVIRFFKILGSC